MTYVGINPLLTVPVSEYARKAHPDHLGGRRIPASIRYHVSKSGGRIDIAALIGNDGNFDRVAIKGNASTNADLSYMTVYDLVQGEIRKVGYSNEFGFDPNAFVLDLNIRKQSPEIANHASNGVAPDSRPIFGYACAETPQFLPYSTIMAETLAGAVDNAFANGHSPFGPDGKVQVHVRYENGPRLHKVVVHAQCRKGKKKEALLYLEKLLRPYIGDAELVLPLFVKGGPREDKGTGSKRLMYGEAIPSGGGSFWGLDGPKIEVIGAARARHEAVSLVANGLADRATVVHGWCMTQREPDVYVSSVPELSSLDTSWFQRFPQTPEEAVERYCLDDPAIIREIDKNGFIGNPNLPWEHPI